MAHRVNPEDLVVECSWTIENINEVANKIIWKEQQGELTEESNAENCFTLSTDPSQKDPTIPCTFKLVLKNNRKFSSLYILSEVPLMEVHGQYEEYLATVKGELLDEVEGTSLYETKIDLKKLQSELLLKFCKIQDKTSLWVYGISAVTKLIAGPPKPPSHSASSTGLPASSGLQALLSSFMPAMPSGAGQSRGKPFDNLEGLIDLKVKELEGRIMNRIEERFNALEKKMDLNNERIVELLTELKK